MLAALAFSLALVQMGGSSDARREFAAGDKDAVLMLPPETVVGTEVRDYLWTTDGGSLVARRQASDVTAADYAAFVKAPGVAADPARLRARTEVVVWSLRRHKATTAFSLLATEGTVDALQTMPGTDRVLFRVDSRFTPPNGGPERTAHSIVMLSTGAGTIQRINVDSADWRTQGQLSLSPKRPLGVVEWEGDDGQAKTVRYFGPTGGLGPARSVPTGGYVWFGEGGEPGFFFIAKENGKRVRKFQTIDPATGRLGPLTTLPPFKEEPEKEPEMTTDVRAPSVEGSTAPTIVLRVRGGKKDEAGVVTTDGLNPVLSPKFDAVAYASQGNLMVRPLVRVPRTAYDEAMAARERTEALSQAKQVGLAFIMYASDMDDVLPENGADYRSMLGPYVRNEGLFNGFNYVFKGGKMTDVESPAETILGYVSYPGGRATVYVDGHAKLIKEQP